MLIEIFFEKSIQKIWKRVINAIIFAPAIRKWGVQLKGEIRRVEGLDFNILCLQKFFRMMFKAEVWKIFQKFLLKNLEWEKKSLSLHPLSETGRCRKPNIRRENVRNAENGKFWKKFEKRYKNIWKLIWKVFIFASAFAS